MLGFSALSQAPLSQATTSTVAVAFLNTSLGQSTAGSLLFNAEANLDLLGVTAVGANSILFDAKASSAIVSVLSSTTINDVVLRGAANVTQSPATASFTAGVVDYLADANITTIGVTAEATPNIFSDVDAKANHTIAGAVSNISAQDVLYTLSANITQPAVTASFTTGVLDYRLTANITPTGASVTGIADSFSDIDAQARITTVGTNSSTAVNDFADVDAKANVVPSAVSAFLTIYIGDFADEDAQARAFMSPAVGVTNTKKVDFSAKSNITTDSTAAIFSISTVDALGGAKATFLGTLANLYNNLADPTAVIFPYVDYTDLYNRANTLYIVSYEGSKEVHIVSEDRTVYTESKQSNNIVYIAEETYTVYIQKQQGSNTVYIAA